jgi:archaellum component FlaC
MARDLASVAQGVKQLKNSLEQISRDNAAVAEQFEAALSQFTHDTAAAAEQFRATLSQITRDTAVIAEQFKASQEQTVRPRVRRKPVAIVPQVEAQPEALIRR